MSAPNLSQTTDTDPFVYQPSMRLTDRLKRRLTPYQSRRQVAVKRDVPIVSFTFDDCPASVLTHGLPALEKRGWQSTVYLASGLFGIENHLGKHMSAQDAQAVSDAGHEIGDHTFSHTDLSEVSVQTALKDIDRNIEHFDKLDLPKARTFAYPYGQTTPALKTALEPRFEGSRGILPNIHRDRVDLNQIGSLPLFNDQSFEALLNAIEALKTKPAWITLFTHDIRDSPSPWGCTPEQFQTVVDAVERLGAQVMSVADAIQNLERKTL